MYILLVLKGSRSNCGVAFRLTAEPHKLTNVPILVGDAHAKELTLMAPSFDKDVSKVLSFRRAPERLRLGKLRTPVPPYNVATM